MVIRRIQQEIDEKKHQSSAFAFFFKGEFPALSLHLLHLF